MEDCKPIEIHYWPLRGLVQTAFYICEYLDVKYEFKQVTDRDVWMASKPGLKEQGLEFPNLPYIKDPNCDNKMMSESMAVFYHLANAGKGCKLLPDCSNIVDYTMYLGVIQEVRGAFTSCAYASTSLEQLKEKIDGFLPGQIERLDS